MSDREKIIEEALKRTPIEGLEWILEDDRFGFGENWSENDLPRCEEEWAGYYIQRAIDVLKQYQKADSFLNAHGWRWDNAEK